MVRNEMSQEIIYNQSDLNRLGLIYRIPDGNCLRIRYEINGFSYKAKVVLTNDSGEIVKESRVYGEKISAEAAMSASLRKDFDWIIDDALKHVPFI